MNTKATHDFFMMIASRRLGFIVIPLVAVMFAADGASAAAYYMSPTGNDSNAGTLAAPWKTLDRLQKAQSIIRPGDTIYFRGGDYVFNNSSARTYYTWSATGTASTPIFYKNYPGEKPVIVGDRTIGPGGTMIYLQNYQTIDGLNFRETDAQRLAGGHRDDPNVRSSTNAWTALSTWATGIVVRNVTIQGFKLGMFYKGDKLLFENNRVSNTRSHRLYISGANGIFRNNVLDGSYGYWNQQGFQMQYVTAVGNKIYGNLIMEGKATGVVFSGRISYNEVFNNVFINPGNKPDSVNGPGTAGATWCEDGPMGPGNKFYNNTLIGRSKNGLIGDPLTGKCAGVRPASQIEIRDNIFYPSTPVRVGLSTHSFPNIHGNIFYNISGSAPAGNRLINPQLVNPLGLNADSAKLLSNSPAIGAESGTSPSEDFAGVKRPIGGASDVGAFEYGGSTPPPPPGTLTDLNGDGITNVADVQITVNQAVGAATCAAGDVNKDGTCNVADVQIVVNKSLGL